MLCPAARRRPAENMSADAIKKRRARSAAAVASQAATITRSSNPLHAWAGAKLVLKNDSDYRVSNWVVYENKLGSEAVRQRVFRNIEDQLNDSGGAEHVHAKQNAKQNAKHGWDVINAEQALDDEVRKITPVITHYCCAVDLLRA